MMEDLKIYKNNPYPWGIYYLIVEIRTQTSNFIRRQEMERAKKEVTQGSVAKKRHLRLTFRCRKTKKTHNIREYQRKTKDLDMTHRQENIKHSNSQESATSDAMANRIREKMLENAFEKGMEGLEMYQGVLDFLLRKTENP